MNNLNDFINEIHADEIVPIDGTLDTDLQWRIEEHVLNAIKQEPATFFNKKKAARKKRVVYALAATLLLALGITAMAAIQNDWDVQLINFMGISDADTLQLESGEVEINQTCKSMCIDYGEQEDGVEKSVQMTVSSSIGDKNSAYVRINTDYELPEDYNPETDYILPDTNHLYISRNKDGSGLIDFASTFTAFVEDGKLGFLFSIENAEKLNKSYVSFEIKDLYLYHDLGMPDSDSEEELLCAGTWNFKWKYSYKSNAKTYYMLKTFENDGITYYLTKIEVSPISVRAEAFRMPQDRQKPHEGKFLEEIHFTDGTVLKVDGFGGGGLGNGMFADFFVTVYKLGTTLNPEEVESIVICGKEIKLK